MMGNHRNRSENKQTSLQAGALVTLFPTNILSGTHDLLLRDHGLYFHSMETR